MYKSALINWGQRARAAARNTAKELLESCGVGMVLSNEQAADLKELLAIEQLSQPRHGDSHFDDKLEAFLKAKVRRSELLAKLPKGCVS